MNKPLLVCLTSTRNYGWVTSAFLKANSLWADYIIMVDQMSTDGTREMALANPKVILLDNEDLSYSETKRSQMAIDRARKIEGDKILIYLAIDEVLPANIFETHDWNKILNSKPSEVFCLVWANLLPDKKRYFSMFNSDGSPLYMARIFHDDDITPFDNQGKDMHTHCIPYPQKDLKESLVTDFKILHFAAYNEEWNLAKQRFYQFVDFDKNNRSIVQLNRMYKGHLKNIKTDKIKNDWIHRKKIETFNLFDEIQTDIKPFFDDYVMKFIGENGINHYRNLNVWDNSFLNSNNIFDPRSFFIKVAHFYLDKTKIISDFFIIRGIDKILKLFI